MKKMSAVAQRSDKAEDASFTSDAVANAPSIAERAANLWPPTALGLAFFVTLCWNAGLLFLAWRLI
jgi:hypothetical protein